MSLRAVKHYIILTNEKQNCIARDLLDVMLFTFAWVRAKVCTALSINLDALSDSNL